MNVNPRVVSDDQICDDSVPLLSYNPLKGVQERPSLGSLSSCQSAYTKAETVRQCKALVDNNATPGASPEDTTMFRVEGLTV